MKTKESQDKLSIIKRLIEKKFTFPNFRREAEMKTAEGRRTNEFFTEDKKEKINGRHN